MLKHMFLWLAPCPHANSSRLSRCHGAAAACPSQRNTSYLPFLVRWPSPPPNHHLHTRAASLYANQHLTATHLLLPSRRRAACFQLILAVCSTNCCSLPPPAQELGSRSLIDFQIACISALPSLALQSCPRVLDMRRVLEEPAAVVSRGDCGLFSRSFDMHA
jgi:hypothetical protein